MKSSKPIGHLVDIMPENIPPDFDLPDNFTTIVLCDGPDGTTCAMISKSHNADLDAPAPLHMIVAAAVSRLWDSGSIQALTPLVCPDLIKQRTLTASETPDKV